MKIIKDTYEQLYDFQKTGVDFLSKARSALLADDVGTGKTAQGIHACQQVGARSILVICSASIKYNWKKEAVKWGYDERDIHILDDKNIEAMPGKGLFIINYDLCWRKRYIRHLLRRKFDVLICDEAHYLKNHKAKRAKAVWLHNGYADIALYRWMMTATPVLNRPVELHAMLSKLCPERLGGYLNYIAYTKRYCDGKDGKWGYEATGAENLEELAGRLNGFMLRRTRDVLPDKTLQKLYMPFSKEIEKYLFKGAETDSIRRKIGLGKVLPSAEHIKNILESENKIVIFAYHTDVIIGLEEELKEYNPVVLRGATPIKDRQKVIDRFIEDPDCRVFIGQIQAAGEGIDGLQKVASMAVFVEIAHTPGIVKQAIGRLYREGQTRPCLFQFLLVEGTIDEQILNSTIFKDKNIKTILKDEKLGLDFSQKTNKEEKMSMEQELKRIADALEKLVSLQENMMEVETPVKVTTADTTEKVEALPPKTEVKKKVVKKEIKTELTKEEYTKLMREAANKISAFSGDPAKTNELFAKLQTIFKTDFPANEHVFDVAPENYVAVSKLVADFLKKEGIE